MSVFWGLIGFDILFTVLVIFDTDFETAISLLSIAVFAPFLLLGILFFSPIVQTVHIDAEGIRIRFFKKTLRKVTWGQLASVQAGSFNRGPIYLFSIRDDGDLNPDKNEDELRLDRRKKIKTAILQYCTDDIREALLKLPPKV